MAYSLADAQNHFYSWAACRAAQAGSAKAKRNELLGALQHSGAVQYLLRVPTPSPTSQEFDTMFYTWGERAIEFLEKKHNKKVSFGIAAKLISVYLKGAWVLHSVEDCSLARNIHPPIDSILLETIDRARGTTLSKTYKWQKLDRSNYETLMESLRKIAGSSPLWRLEEYWRP
ncbi:hypothetical protein [Malikia spinosa]|uniref:Uncharacterized protein n=1 Tax=Malikia spinosa TaxID=86180 RepID=A0A7C9NA20_9BURK|nr:hypothetical protein [Malikia spinosa]MYZ50859.1 hypothetical protein [Malikia spinosa]